MDLPVEVILIPLIENDVYDSLDPHPSSEDVTSDFKSYVALNSS